MLTLVRYYSFNAPLDVDPLTTQPAADAYGTLQKSKTGYALVNAWVVDAEGRKVSPPPPVEFDLGIFTLSSTEAVRPAGATGGSIVRNALWGRGVISTAINPAGIWQIQTELGSTTSFTALVTSVTTSAPGFFLAIYADLDARGPRRGDV